MTCSLLPIPGEFVGGSLLLGAPLVSWRITLPASLVILGGLIFYWERLGGRDVPPSRRRLRRAATVVQVALLFLLVYASSIVDPTLRPSRFVIAWSAAFMLALFVLVLAGVDVANNVRLHRRARIRFHADQARARAAAETRLAAGGPSDDDDDGPSR